MQKNKADPLSPRWMLHVCVCAWLPPACFMSPPKTTGPVICVPVAFKNSSAQWCWLSLLMVIPPSVPDIISLLFAGWAKTWCHCGTTSPGSEPVLYLSKQLLSKEALARKRPLELGKGKQTHRLTGTCWKSRKLTGCSTQHWPSWQD